MTHSANRYSSSKAKGILKAYYGYSFESDLSEANLLQPLDFLQHSSSTASVDSEALNLFPNPFTGTVTIRNPLAEQVTLSIYTTSGKIVRTYSIDGKGAMQLNTALQTGIYYYSIQGHNELFTEKGKLIIID